MDKVVIFGVFEFLGFHFCTNLLEQGYEVEGVHFAQLEADEFLDEKRLAIGRNSNFTEVDISNFQRDSQLKGNPLIIIDYYDFYMRNDTSRFEKFLQLENFFENNAKVLSEAHSKVIMLLPIQWLSDGIFSHLHKNILSYDIYLPTVYGPWQQRTFLFQQALLKSSQKINEFFLNDREWMNDAIYIDDVVKTSLEILERKIATYLLKSDIEDHWNKCAHFLSLPLIEFTPQNRLQIVEPFDVQEIMVKGGISFSEGIETQNRHLKSLL